MVEPDFNLLPALAALLEEGSVVGASRRLNLSASAMSRTLARLRDATGDALLVRAGRVMVLTPYAQELASRVPALTREVRQALRPPASDLDLATLRRVFTLRTNEGFVQAVSAPLIALVATQAPGVMLRFAPKPDKAAQPLRDGSVDLEIGVVDTDAPEILTRLLFRDRFAGVARLGHPLLHDAITAERYAACGHVVASRRGRTHGPVDTALAEIGLARDVRVVVPGYPDALRIARQSDLVALVPKSCLKADGDGLRAFDLPVVTPEIRVSVQWHPRLDADAAHRWLRGVLVSLCAEMFS